MLDPQIKEELLQEIESQFIGFHTIGLIKTLLTPKAEDPKAQAKIQQAELEADAKERAEKILNKVLAVNSVNLDAVLKPSSEITQPDTEKTPESDWVHNGHMSLD